MTPEIGKEDGRDLPFDDERASLLAQIYVHKHRVLNKNTNLQELIDETKKKGQLAQRRLVNSLVPGRVTFLSLQQLAPMAAIFVQIRDWIAQCRAFFRTALAPDVAPLQGEPRVDLRPRELAPKSFPRCAGRAAANGHGKTLAVDFVGIRFHRPCERSTKVGTRARRAMGGSAGS